MIPKGGFDAAAGQGIEAFREPVARLLPFLEDRVGLITSFDDVSMLTVALNRLRRWHRPGLLCIGDAAHAMSPVFGVGINLAVQDAVAAANLLAEPLRRRSRDPGVPARPGPAPPHPAHRDHPGSPSAWCRTG